ncbi:MAG: LytTR family DNA-binding domain-containing protein [Acholeplasmataceae bacterium]
MKINLKRQPSFGEPVVTIECDEQDDTIQEILNCLDASLVTGKKNGRTFVFKPNQIYYVESIEDAGYLYTKDDIFDCKYRLYEAEKMSPFFIRVNKQTVLNYRKIKAFKSTYNGKLEATLLNGDRIEISRNYVKALKAVLEGGK